MRTYYGMPSPFYFFYSSMIGRIHSLESFGTVDGPGVRFVAFMQGCPLRCLYCHNPDTWNPKGPCQYEFTPEELLQETLKYRSYIKRGGVTVSGGEPLLQSAFVSEFFRLCHQEGLHTALDTSGAFCGEEAMQVLRHTDLALLDIKTMDPQLYPVLTGVPQTHNLLFLDLLEERGIKTWIRHVVVPGINDNDNALRLLAEHIAKYRCVEKLEILPYHTLGTYKYRQLSLHYPLEHVAPLSGQRAEEIRKNLSQYCNLPVE